MATTRTLKEFLLSAEIPSFAEWENANSGTFHLSGLTPPSASMLVAKRFLFQNKNTLIIVKDYRSAETWLEHLEAFVDKDDLLFLPAIGLKPYEEKIPFDGLLEERLRFFVHVEEKPHLVICPLDSLLTRLPSPKFLNEKTLHFQVGDRIEPSTLRKKFLDMGFKEQPMVSSVGEFSMRGCIVDVNGFLHEHPVRLEFFGDELESIRPFDIFTQRSVENLEEISIYPMGEFSLPYQERFELGENLNGIWWKRSSYENLNASVFDYLPSADIVFEESGALAEMASSLWKNFEKKFREMEGSVYAAFPPEKNWWKYVSFSEYFRSAVSLDITRIETDAANWNKLEVRPQVFDNSGIEGLESKIHEYVASGGRLYLVAPTSGALSRMQHLFGDAQVEEFLEGSLTEGFWLDSDKVAFLSDARIFNRHQKKGRKRSIAGSVSSALLVESLSRGDLVAHEDHGVGRYLGLVRVEVNGGQVDCALLEYAGGDRLRFPVSDLQKIERLQQPEDGEVKLNKLGSKVWENQKKRVKEKVIKIAQELVELYAKRELMEGFAFPPDSKLQEEFESSFEYIPTPDQVAATNDIKRDMESARPMDRLVCGDVGFGKTEVAMRAVFKCVLSKKQVALLVPTTILAAQHYENFCERFSSFPVHIALLNRYKTVKEKKEIFERLEQGSIDIVIGTHALLSEKGRFKDLGLLVIDEEQKFGVKQKEKLKELRLSVDTLSMSATPIPRSLHLSLTGVRDISLINTAPMNRLPVETKLMRRDDAILAEVVRDELARGGQVFVVNDHVQGIESLAAEVESWVPEARVAVAHGQMNDRDLERTMEAFLSGNFDVLVSTTIIESGLDIPRANTIIIMNAHHFGISQLYQMRGRVGRSDVLAYAYLVIPARGEISSDSSKRLEALAQFTDLGSGYQLAMRDLEIRGAGNLLGSEQHGFIAEVGFETYVRLVKEAVEMLRGSTVEKPLQPRLELGVDAYLPETWIEDGLTRISLYQRIARVKTLQELENLRSELKDRFGALPEAAEMLLLVTEIGLCAAFLKIQGLLLRRSLLAITFTEFPPPDPQTLAEILSLSPYPMRYLANTPLQAVVELGTGSVHDQALRSLELFRAFEKRSNAPLQKVQS